MGSVGAKLSRSKLSRLRGYGRRKDAADWRSWSSEPREVEVDSRWEAKLTMDAFHGIERRQPYVWNREQRRADIGALPSRGKSRSDKIHTDALVKLRRVTVVALLVLSGSWREVAEKTMEDLVDLAPLMDFPVNS